jgi:hypothetical protein
LRKSYFYLRIVQARTHLIHIKSALVMDEIRF